MDAYGRVLPNCGSIGRITRPTRLSGLDQGWFQWRPEHRRTGAGLLSSTGSSRVLDRDDPRPVWFSIWGGPRELAQALWKVQQTRTADELAAFKHRIRVVSINDQDRTAGWVKQHHPDVFWIFSE